MRERIVQKLVSYIHKKDSNYSNEQLEVIQYGLEGIYILITKSIVIFTVAYLLGIIKEVFLFTLLYNVIRMPSFGLHATKSWMCYLSSLIIFLILPYVCKTITFDPLWKGILGAISIILIYKNAPADTVKRPIIDPKRRRNYKIISTIIAITFAFLSITIKNNFLSNAFVISILLQNFMISPYIYQLFHLPYDNYKSYLAESVTV